MFNTININLKYLGATAIVLLFPHNNTNIIYCINLDRNIKMVFIKSPIKYIFQREGYLLLFYEIYKK